MRNGMAAGRPACASRVIAWARGLARYGALAAALSLLLFPSTGFTLDCPDSGRNSAATAAASEPPSAESQAPLVTLFHGERPQQAVILIAGIYNDHHYFQPWWECFTGERIMLLGWQHPHHEQRLEHSARLLAEEMAKLSRLGVRKVTLLAHSIGGLVAKGAVDRLTQQNLWDSFATIELHALGTPWGGFPGADLAHANPLGQLVSYVAGHPAWLDLGTHSEYLAGLARPMPPNGRLANYIGASDTVASPRSKDAEQRYARLLQHAAASVELSGVNHDSYVQHDINALRRFRDRPAATDQMAEMAEQLAETEETYTSGASD